MDYEVLLERHPDAVAFVIAKIQAKFQPEELLWCYEYALGGVLSEKNISVDRKVNAIKAGTRIWIRATPEHTLDMWVSGLVPIPFELSELIRIKYVEEAETERIRAVEAEITEKIYIEAAKKIAATLDANVYLTHLRDWQARAFVPGPKWCLMLERNGYMSQQCVDPDGKVWGCEELT